MTATVKDLAEAGKAIRAATQQAQQASREMAEQLGTKRAQRPPEVQPEAPEASP